MSGPPPALLRGHPLAVGVVIEDTLIGPEAAQARVFAHWSEGATVWALDPLPGERRQRWWVRWASPRRLPVAAAGGALVVQRGDASVGVDWSGAASEAPTEGDLILAVAGSLVTWRVAAEGVRRRGEGDLRARPVDVSCWLDLTAYHITPVQPLGPPPPPPAPPVEAAGKAIRVVFEGLVPPADPQRAQIINALKGELPLAEPSPTALLSPPTPIRPLATLRALFQAIFGGQPPAQTAAQGVPAPQPPTGPTRPPLRARLMHALLRMGFGQRTLRDQARYLNETVEMFEQGNYLEALKRAIPLGGEAEAGGPPSWMPGIPEARTQLDIQPRRLSGGGWQLNLGPQGYDQLRLLYRRAFERLAAQGEIDQAAFVLAELLQADEEAVAFLERHGRHRLAAELAEARGLDPALIIRQWMLADAPDRAVALARRHGAFQAALDLLGDDHPERQAALRRLWVRHLIRSGEPVQAVHAGWPEWRGDRDHPLAAILEAQIDLALGLEDEAGAAMMALKLRAISGAAPGADLKAKIEALLQAPGVEGRRRQRAFIDTLTGGGDQLGLPGLTSPEAAAQPLIRAFTRRLISQEGDLTKGRISQHAQATEDPIFWADLQRLNLSAPPENPFVRYYHGGDPLHLHHGGLGGRRDVLDAAPVAGGGYAVALGEGGLWLTDAEGRPQRRLRTPAHHLVVADGGRRLLALAPRGEIWRVSRVNVITGEADTWGDLGLDAWAQSFNGEQWYVAPSGGGEMMSLDVFAEDLKALWRVRCEGTVDAIARDQQHSVWRVAGAHGVQLWQLESPAMILRRRAPISDPGSGLITVGTTLVWDTFEGYISYDPSLLSSQIDLNAEDTQLPICLDRRWWCVAKRVGGEHLVHVQFGGEPQPRAILHLGAGEALPRLRALHGALMIIGPSGQILDVLPDQARCHVFHVRT